MPIDQELIKAVKIAATEAGQSEKVGKRLIAWLEGLSESELDKETNMSHLETVFRSLEVDLDGDSNEI